MSTGKNSKLETLVASIGRVGGRLGSCAQVRRLQVQSWGTTRHRYARSQARFNSGVRVGENEMFAQDAGCDVILPALSYLVPDK